MAFDHSRSRWLGIGDLIAELIGAVALELTSSEFCLKLGPSPQAMVGDDAALVAIAVGLDSVPDAFRELAEREL